MLSIKEHVSRTFDINRHVKVAIDEMFFAHAVLSSDEKTLFSIDNKDFNTIHSITCSDSGIIEHKYHHNKTKHGPPRRCNSRSVIYHNETLLLCDGFIDYYIYNDDSNASTSNNETVFWEFDITNKTWSTLFLTGDKPERRQHHTFIKYDKFAIIFGGITMSTHANSKSTKLYDLFLVNLETLNCRKIFNSKVCGGKIGCAQIINDSVMIVEMLDEFENYTQIEYYHIDIKNLINSDNNNYNRHCDFKTTIILSSIRSRNNINDNSLQFKSNNNCLIVFNKDIIHLYHNSHGDLDLNKRCRPKVKLNASACFSDLELVSARLKYINAHWINDRFIWIGCYSWIERSYNYRGSMAAPGSSFAAAQENDKIMYRLWISNVFDNDDDHKDKASIMWKSDKKYKIIKQIGSGATSMVYDAIVHKSSFKYVNFRSQHGIKRNKAIVIKQQKSFMEFEKQNVDCNQSTSMTGPSEKNVTITSNCKEGLVKEYEILKLINNTNHCKDITCEVYEMFIENNIPHLVLSRLGVSLQHLFIQFNYKFSLSQVCMILNQTILILFKLHSIGYVHNDIKPENVLIGNMNEKDQSVKLHLIDFGLCKPFWNFKTNKHIEQQSTQGKFEGTFRFSSRNHHCFEMNQSRRDDLESAIYMTIYLRKNSLPWIIDDEQYKQDEMDEIAKIHSKTKQLKLESKVLDICSDMPPSFETALNYVWNLRFDQCPDYCYLQSLINLAKPQEIEEKESVARSRKMTTFELPRQSSDVHFIGARINAGSDDEHRLDSSNTSAELEQKISEETRNAEDVELNSGLELKPLFGEQRLDTSMIDKYNTAIKLSSNLTKQNYRTHLSVHGLRTRLGYLINSLIIDKGVPKYKPQQDYGAIIVFEPAMININTTRNPGNVKLNGHIYMLPVSKCRDINRNYQRSGGMMLKGRIHGAIYYHFFKDNIHESTVRKSVTENNNTSVTQLSFIRGFSVLVNQATNDISYKHNSTAFNFINSKLYDKKYRTLEPCEQKFIEYSLNRYWNENNNGIGTEYSFDEFMKHESTSLLDTINENTNNNTDTKEDNEMISGYDNQILGRLIKMSNQDGSQQLYFYKNVYLPVSCCMKIMYFLENKNKFALSKLCQNSYQFIKQYCFQHSTNLVIATLKRIRQHYDSSCSINHCTFEFGSIERKNVTSIELDDINFRDLSLYNDCRRYLMIDKDLFNQENIKYQIIFNRIDNTIAKNMIVSLLHYNRILLKLNRINDCTNHLIKISVPRGNTFTPKLHEFGDNCNDNLYYNDDTVLWYWKASDELGWNQYPSEFQNYIENSFNSFVRSEWEDDHNMDVAAKSVVLNQSYYQLYRVWFDTSHVVLDSSSNVHNVNHIQWAEAFTQYFYQENVNNKKYRIVKRINYSQEKRYVQSLNILDGYFDADCLIRLSLK